MKTNILNFIKFTACVIFLSFYSCSKEEHMSENLNLETEDKVIRERDPENPWDPNMFERANDQILTKSMTGPLTAREYSGCSWKLNYSPIDNNDNIGIPVIDVDLYENDDIIEKSLQETEKNNSDSRMYSFANYDRFTTKSFQMKAFSAKSNFSMFGVKAAVNADYNKTFSERTENNSSNVFGYYEYINIKKQYSLELPEWDLYKRYVSMKYLTDKFMTLLSTNTPQAFMKKYGSYILTDYQVGGKVCFSYLGKTSSTLSVVDSEEKMDVAMSASFLKKVGGELKAKYEKETYEEVKSSFEEMNLFVRCIGGVPSYEIAKPISLQSFEVNLTDWEKSLQNESTHELVKIMDNGLIPITDFILEDNLKEMYSDLYDMESLKEGQFVEPYIEIYKEPDGFIYNGYNTNTWRGRISLVTRYGDNLTLAYISQTPKDKFDAFMNETIEEIKSIFGVKIIEKARMKKSRSDMGTGVIDPGHTINRAYKYFGKDHLSKYVKPNGITYLIYNPPTAGKVYVYTVHDDIVKQAYGIREFIETLPTVELDFIKASDPAAYEFNAI